MIYEAESNWAGLSEVESGRIMKEYADFGEEAGRAGVVRGGEALEPVASATSVRVRDGERLLTDGPFAEARDLGLVFSPGYGRRRPRSRLLGCRCGAGYATGSLTGAHALLTIGWSSGGSGEGMEHPRAVVRHSGVVTIREGSTMRLTLIAAAAAASVLAVACGGGGGSATSTSAATQTTTTPSPGTMTTSPPPEPGCHPSGTELEIEAEGAGPAHTVKYDTDCLAAPADTPFTIAFTNSSVGTKHNVSILSTGSGPVSTLFNGDIISGVATVTYEVDPIPAGIYRFKCNVHPSLMVGQFVVE